ncbi:hypothetical protein TTHERM_000430119 (macronuclear) [Tetrahymena thermophila SB210]|uniref:Uncharacterized protein n=1 Tax=Tetrahymena thermophila (strain SB210) TaxID=312017 RepID=W7XHL7_TETTS|nr:hypothetical protein TTHERM_000430119 [Tetrahymena thermophila SB210]EWS72619.1 hypothetical protein TTHERM_000430119 [Tetrahymena thermophila SB210]|eukprot:XP_012654902.1 hypothetical protein TTHERM_000430119 [Tetrahymena thermophila SB210]
MLYLNNIYLRIFRFIKKFLSKLTKKEKNNQRIVNDIRKVKGIFNELITIRNKQLINLSIILYVNKKNIINIKNVQFNLFLSITNQCQVIYFNRKGQTYTNYFVSIFQYYD